MGTMVYNDNGLDFILNEEGRVIPNAGGSFRYEYHYKDYLKQYPPGFFRFGWQWFGR